MTFTVLFKRRSEQTMFRDQIEICYDHVGLWAVCAQRFEFLAFIAYSRLQTKQSSCLDTKEFFGPTNRRGILKYLLVYEILKLCTLN